MSTYLDGVFLGSQPTFDSNAQPMYMLLEGNITRNAPIGGEPLPDTLETQVDWVRVWQRPPGARRCVASFPGVSGSHVSAPSTAPLQITDVVDVRVVTTPDDDTPAANQVPVAMWRVFGDQQGWQLVHGTNGRYSFDWMNGTTEVTRFEGSAAGFVQPGRGIYRVLFQSDVAGDAIATFYRGDTIDGPWTLFGTKTDAGFGGPLRVSTDALTISGRDLGTVAPYAGIIEAVQIRHGDDGPIVAHFDPSDKTPGDRHFTDQHGNAWTVNSTARIVQDNPQPVIYSTANPPRLGTGQ
jgi:hypothetical protein